MHRQSPPTLAGPDGVLPRPARSGVGATGTLTDVTASRGEAVLRFTEEHALFRQTVRDLVQKEIRAGRQAYVVSPAIDPSEEGKVNLRDLQAMEALLRSRLPEAAIEVVHGRLKPGEFAERMARFVSGEAQLLLATTVIEVGVDVPNATVMVVDHAERFGLGQLHQLRGRVGRGGGRSSFVMLSGSETERLQILLETQDGFKIAQRDLELRGPGEFFGTRQSGVPQFQVADLVRDRELLIRCREAADQAIARGLDDGQLAWLKAEQARLKLAEVS